LTNCHVELSLPGLERFAIGEPGGIDSGPGAFGHGNSSAMPPQDKVDSIYYAHGMKLPLSQRLAIHARKNMLEHFVAVMRPVSSTTVIDFGVSEEVNDEANILEQYYAFPEQITCAGIGNGDAVRKAFPKVHYRSIRPHEPLPFAEHEFDIAFSNAVFEHLGSDENRQRTLRDLLRVAKRVYLTVPNGWFPVEHHTGIPLLHYVPALFRRVLRHTGLAYWSDPHNMDFMTKRRMLALRPPDRKFETAYCGIRLGPASSNIAIWTP
jgi:SAM-dependent methyltransferase